jgi:hypothetical protein
MLTTQKLHDDDGIDLALRLQKLEYDVTSLSDTMEKNTKATEELVKAWEGSKFTLTLAKKAAAFGLFCLAVLAAWQKYRVS